MEQQPENKKKKLATYIIIGVAVAAGVLVQQVFKKPLFDKQLAEAASEINKTCPMMVDQETRLDNAMAMPGNELLYNYTLVNVSKDSIDVNKFKEILQAQMLNDIKSNPQLKIFREHATKLSYDFKDKNNIHFCQIAFTAEQYK